MAQVIITFRVMPESPDTDIAAVEKKVKDSIAKFTGNTEFRTDVQPFAFGLKAITITFIMDEAKGSTETLEQQLCDVEGVNSVEVTDVRRAVG